jgi:hypothetical protein
MGVLDELRDAIGRAHPDLEVETGADGRWLRVAQKGHLADPDHTRVTLEESEDAVLLDGLWRLPVRVGGGHAVGDFLLAYVTEAIENHGWEVPVLLEGGPRHGSRLTKRRDDLVGRLLFARPGRGPDDPSRGDLYKWHLRRAPSGEYVCVYERSMVGPELDQFLARGVESTGPFVVIPDS